MQQFFKTENDEETEMLLKLNNNRKYQFDEDGRAYTLNYYKTEHFGGGVLQMVIYIPHISLKFSDSRKKCGKDGCDSCHRHFPKLKWYCRRCREDPSFKDRNKTWEVKFPEVKFEKFKASKNIRDLEISSDDDFML